MFVSLMMQTVVDRLRCPALAPTAVHGRRPRPTSQCRQRLVNTHLYSGGCRRAGGRSVDDYRLVCFSILTRVGMSKNRPLRCIQLLVFCIQYLIYQPTNYNRLPIRAPPPDRVSPPLSHYRDETHYTSCPTTSADEGMHSSAKQPTSVKSVLTVDQQWTSVSI